MCQDDDNVRNCVQEAPSSWNVYPFPCVLGSYLVMKASWAALTFSGLPPQAFSADACSARPYEKESAHGLIRRAPSQAHASTVPSSALQVRTTVPTKQCSQAWGRSTCVTHGMNIDVPRGMLPGCCLRGSYSIHLASHCLQGCYQQQDAPGNLLPSGTFNTRAGAAAPQASPARQPSSKTQPPKP